MAATPLEQILAHAVDLADSELQGNDAAAADLRTLLKAGRKPHVVKPCYAPGADDPEYEIFLQIRRSE